MLAGPGELSGMSSGTDRALAIARHLLLGGTVGGVRFGALPQLLIHDTRPEVRGQVYINLQSRWALFRSRPTNEPATEEDLPELHAEEEVLQILHLSNHRIERVDFGATAPHLILSLERGLVLFVWGGNERYETWQVGVAFGEPGTRWEVICLPGNGLAAWASEGFRVPDAG